MANFLPNSQLGNWVEDKNYILEVFYHIISITTSLNTLLAHCCKVPMCKRSWSHPNIILFVFLFCFILFKICSVPLQKRSELNLSFYLCFTYTKKAHVEQEEGPVIMIFSSCIIFCILRVYFWVQVAYGLLPSIWNSYASKSINFSDYVWAEA